MEAAVLRALVLGTVQGLTEFLPVSSSGHLIAVRGWLGWPDDGLVFDAALHLGTLLALLLFFRTTVTALLRGHNRQLLGALALGTLPAALAGLILERFLSTTFREGPSVSFLFLLTAGVLALAELRVERAPPLSTGWGIRSALLVGVAQMFAIVPGLSRSGLTMAVGLLVGWPRGQAVAFSFLLSIPITAGTSLFGLWNATSSAGVLFPFLLGTVVAFGVGLCSLAVFWRIGRTRRFWPYVVYLVALSFLTRSS